MVDDKTHINGIVTDSASVLRPEEPFCHLVRLSFSFANKKARLSVLVRGARLCHALLKALDSPLNYLARRHPKGKGYRLASHVSAFQRSQFSRDKVCNSLADPVGPPGDGSRHRAMSVPFFQTGQGKYSKF